MPVCGGDRLTPCFYSVIISLSTFKDFLKNFLILVAIVCASQSTVHAEGFLARDFLQLPDASKKFWLHGAMLTLSHIAANQNQELGQCVTDWYFNESIGERNWLILESMKKYPDVSPTTILIALTEKSCGKYSELKT